MYMDAQNRPSLNQSVAAGAGTIVSTDSIDLLSTVDNPSRSGRPMRAVAVLTTALAGAGTSVQAQLIASNNSNLSSPVVLATGTAAPVATAAAGTKLLDVPLPDIEGYRYLGFQYIVAGGTTTAGAVTSGIVGGTDRNSSIIPMNLG